MLSKKVFELRKRKGCISYEDSVHRELLKNEHHEIINKSSPNIFLLNCLRFQKSKAKHIWKYQAHQRTFISHPEYIKNIYSSKNSPEFNLTVKSSQSVAVYILKII
jgi:hypothetical protein